MLTEAARGSEKAAVVTRPNAKMKRTMFLVHCSEVVGVRLQGSTCVYVFFGRTRRLLHREADSWAGLILVRCPDVLEEDPGRRTRFR